jgi:hypothetical protein
MHDAEDPDAGGRIPAVRSTGSGTSEPQFAKKGDLEDVEAQVTGLDGKINARDPWLILALALIVGLGVCLGFAWQRASQAEHLAAKATQSLANVQALNASLAGDITAMKANYASVRAGYDSLKTSLAAVRGSVSAVRSSVADVEQQMAGEKFATNAELQQVKSEVESQVTTSAAATQDTLATFRTLLLSSMDTYGSQVTGQQSAGLDALRNEFHNQASRDRNRQTAWNWLGLVSHVIAQSRRLR